jgi:hypothetical protein
MARLPPEDHPEQGASSFPDNAVQQVSSEALGQRRLILSRSFQTMMKDLRKLYPFWRFRSLSLL